MKIDGALKGGIAGITTLGVLTQALGGVKGDSAHSTLLRKGKLRKRLKKTGSKNGFKSTNQYIRLAEDILGSAAFLGIKSLSKKKNTMLKGGVLGTVAGLGNVFLNKDEHNDHQDEMHASDEKEQIESISSKLLKVSLYTIGGLVVGKLVENMKKKRKRKK